MIDTIRQKVPQEELLAQLAEEASELAQAALKLRRVYSGVNPTPVTRREAFANLLEEIADVRLLVLVLGLDTPFYRIDCERTMEAKLSRWVSRLEEVRP